MSARCEYAVAFGLFECVADIGELSMAVQIAKFAMLRLLCFRFLRSLRTLSMLVALSVSVVFYNMWCWLTKCLSSVMFLFSLLLLC